MAKWLDFKKKGTWIISEKQVKCFRSYTDVSSVNESQSEAKQNFSALKWKALYTC